MGSCIIHVLFPLLSENSDLVAASYDHDKLTQEDDRKSLSHYVIIDFLYSFWTNLWISSPVKIRSFLNMLHKLAFSWFHNKQLA